MVERLWTRGRFSGHTVHVVHLTVLDSIGGVIIEYSRYECGLLRPAYEIVAGPGDARCRECVAKIVTDRLIHGRV